MRAIRRAEVAEHEARANVMEARAINQAAEGHVVRAARLEHKSHEQRVDAIVDSRHPVAVAAACRPPPVGAAVVAAEVVATDRAVREAEMAAAVTYGTRNSMRPLSVGAYDAYPAAGAQYGYGYPPGGAGYPMGYPPAAGYPPSGYPPAAGYPPQGAGYPPPAGYPPYQQPGAYP